MAIASSIIAASIIAGTSVASAAIASHGQNQAAETNAKANEDAIAASKEGTTGQLQAAQEALDYQKQQDAAQQRRLLPYQSLGSSALGALGSGLGLNSVVSGTGIDAMVPRGTVGGGVGGGMEGQAPIQPVSTPATTATEGQSGPLSLAQLGASQSRSSVRPAQVGDTRTINGQPAQWDGHGWLATGAA